MSLLDDEGVNEPVRRRSSITRDLVWTTLTSAAILLGNVILASLLAQRGATEVFGPYQLAKRVGASVMPVLSLGLSLGIVRYIAGAVDQRDRDRFTVVGIGITFAIAIISTGVLLVAPETFSQLLLGSVDPPLMWAMWAYTIALAMNMMVYSFYRGELTQTRANWNTLIAMTIAPVLVVALAPSSWQAVLLLSSVSAVVIVWNGSQLMFRLVTSLANRPTKKHLLEGGRVLLGYSLSRVPGSVSMSLILTVGALVATRAGEALAASYVLAGMTLVQVAGASLQAFGTVLMPRVAELSAQGQSKPIVTVCVRLIYITTTMSALMVPLLFVVAPDAVSLWLGPEFAGAVPAIRVIVFGIPAMLFIAVLRGVLDATIRQPVNTYAATTGLAVCGIGSLLVSPASASALSAAFVVGEWVSAGTMLAVVFIRFKPRFHGWFHAGTAGIALAFGGVAYFAGGLAGEMAPYARLGLAVLFGAVALVLSVWYAPEDTGLRQRVRRMVRVAE